MGRIVVLVTALGLAAFTAVDVDCPDQTESIERVETTLALPVLAPASIPRPAAVRWQTTVRDTGREPSASIFRPPV